MTGTSPTPGPALSTTRTSTAASTRNEGGPGRATAHVGRVRRPEGEGSWLCLAGEHAPGVAGAVEIFCRDIAALWEQAHRSLWSAIAQVTAGEGETTEDVTLITPVYVHGRR